MVEILLFAPVWVVEDLGFEFPSLNYYSLQKSPTSKAFVITSRSQDTTKLAFYLPPDTWWLDTILVHPYCLGFAFDTLGEPHLFFWSQEDTALFCFYKPSPGDTWRGGDTFRFHYGSFGGLSFMGGMACTHARGAGVFVNLHENFQPLPWIEYLIFFLFNQGQGERVLWESPSCELVGKDGKDYHYKLTLYGAPYGIGGRDVGLKMSTYYGHSPNYDSANWCSGSIDSSASYIIFRDAWRTKHSWLNVFPKGASFYYWDSLVLVSEDTIMPLPLKGDIELLGKSQWIIGTGGTPILIHFPWGIDTVPDFSDGDVSIYLTEDTTLYVAYRAPDGHLHIAHKKVIPMPVEEKSPEELAFKNVWRAGEDIRVPWRWGYELYDASGKLVRRGPGPEIGRLRSGVYILKLGEGVRKLVVR